MDRICCNDSFRGLVFAGILEMRNGIDGGPAAWLLDARYVWIWERLGERCFSLGCEGPGTDIDSEAECEIGFMVVCELRLAKVPAKSAGGTVGEKLARVVGLGASRDMGGFVLGFSIGGERGSGVSDEKFCFPIGDVTVEGGDKGKDLCGYIVLRGLTGFDRNGFG